jgi:cytidine deaminase
MFLARGIQVRSGSLSRQIGAAILRKDGSVVAIGTNEAARPISGGQYWFKDDHEYRGRDMVYRPTDTSDEFRAQMLADLLDRLDRAKALSETFSTDKYKDDPQRAEELRKQRLEKLYFEKSGALRKARLRDNIDYIRAVHAEGAAIIDAARHGVATKKCILFSTTFPCHECARHIVAAGIKEVVYLEPYPKSAVKSLYEDSIQVDPYHRDKRKLLFRTFVGVSPSRYLEFFTVDRERKDVHGQRIRFDLRTEDPHLPEYTPPASAAESTERLELQRFTEFLEQVKTQTSSPSTTTSTTP